MNCYNCLTLTGRDATLSG